jgi:flagellar export protein FliJ
MVLARFTVLLEIRQAAVEEAQRTLGRLESQRREITALRDRLLEDAANATLQPVALILREQLAAFRRRMQDDAAAAGRRIADQDVLIETARDRLNEAMRDRKSVEALRERDRQQHLASERRREGRANDEFAARRRQEAAP